jgi:HTH-type transcriptional regulator/antitoxin HigA
MGIRPIRTKAGHRRALEQIDGLMGARRDTPEGDLLDVAATLVEAYEAKHYPLDLPDPVDAIGYTRSNGSSRRAT